MSQLPIRTSYDEVPYPSYPYPYTHPDHLATIATLLGMKPAAADGCRMLELGLAAGGNLIPHAQSLPASTFVGLDLSGEQVGEGQKRVAALGLKNIELRQMSILDVDESLGQFDFIVCHGVFSWVPRPVQDALLGVYARNLAFNGVGYISYNTYPGWHMRGMIRAMMMQHVKRFRHQPPAIRVGQARALLDFLAKSVPEKNTPYSLLLRENLELIQKCSDSYLFHEHLEECNDPIYFTDFCERLMARGLRYLGETEFQVMVPATSFPASVHEELSQLAPNLIDMEQYMDFLRNRMFRQTLVCHEHVQPNYEIRGDRLTSFHVASPAKPCAEAPDLTSEGPVEFKGHKDLTLTATAPVVKAALVCLGEVWPHAIAFDRLLTEARARLRNGTADDAALAQEDALTLGRALLTAYASAGHAMLELWLCPPVFVAEVSERPVVHALARLQATTDRQVSNLRHETVNLSEFDRQVLPLLDGSRDRPALVQALLERYMAGQLKMAEDDKPVTDVARAEDILGQLLEQQLPRLAKAALFIA